VEKMNAKIFLIEAGRKKIWRMGQEFNLNEFQLLNALSGW
jgi:hypothetical protein